jgi:hypothetical protein
VSAAANTTDHHSIARAARVRSSVAATATTAGGERAEKQRSYFADLASNQHEPTTRQQVFETPEHTRFRFLHQDAIASFASRSSGLAPRGGFGGEALGTNAPYRCFPV